MNQPATQLELLKIKKPFKNGSANKLDFSDKAFHDWYRFVLSFPPHLVRDYLKKFGLRSSDTILDPFCGTGTTIVEAKLNGIMGIGIEANPIAHLAASTKVNWELEPNNLIEHASKVSASTLEALSNLSSGTIISLTEEAFKILLKDSISPLPLHKSLVLLEQIRGLKDDENIYHCELIALAKTLVFSSSNLYFGPEVGVRKSKKTDVQVIENWLNEVSNIANDLRNKPKNAPQSFIYRADSREASQILNSSSIDAVFTSPPYPNEKDYTRTTRLESVVLGFINNKTELQALKKKLLRSNTRNVYKEDKDDDWVAEHSEIQSIAQAIETRRIELGKTSGFEKLYGKVTKLYFGGMARHLADLRSLLKPGAYLGYVVGDQASYLQVMIRTGQLIASIAQSLGYEVVSIDLFRTRLSTVTKMQIREEVVVLRWPGNVKV